MMNATVQESITTISTYQTTITKQGNTSLYQRISPHLSKQVILLIFTALLLCSSQIVSHNQPAAHAANPGPGNACSWYTVHWGDTLTNIAWSHRTTVWTLAQVNYIRNINLIFVNQQLCIPYRAGGVSSGSSSGGTAGVLSNGVVRWYAYNALDWSNR